MYLANFCFVLLSCFYHTYFIRFYFVLWQSSLKSLCFLCVLQALNYKFGLSLKVILLIEAVVQSILNYLGLSSKTLLKEAEFEKIIFRICGMKRATIELAFTKTCSYLINCAFLQKKNIIFLFFLLKTSFINANIHSFRAFLSHRFLFNRVSLIIRHTALKPSMAYCGQ